MVGVGNAHVQLLAFPRHSCSYFGSIGAGIDAPRSSRLCKFSQVAKRVLSTCLGVWECLGRAEKTDKEEGK